MLSTANSHEVKRRAEMYAEAFLAEVMKLPHVTPPSADVAAMLKGWLASAFIMGFGAGEVESSTHPHSRRRRGDG